MKQFCLGKTVGIFSECQPFLAHVQIVYLLTWISFRCGMSSALPLKNSVRKEAEIKLLSLVQAL